jgi:hypothetical protein
MERIKAARNGAIGEPLIAPPQEVLEVEAKEEPLPPLSPPKPLEEIIKEHESVRKKQQRIENLQLRLAMADWIGLILALAIILLFLWLILHHQR